MLRSISLARPLRAWLAALAMLATVLLGVQTRAVAQTHPPASSLTPSANQAQPSPIIAAQRAKLEAIRIELAQTEAGIDRRGKSDEALQAIRQTVEPLATGTREVIAELTPRAEAIRMRLKELGPKPDEKSPSEGVEVTREREERQAELNEYDDTLRLSRSLLVQADQISQGIADRRRNLFTSRLFESTSSVLSPKLWYAVGQDLPNDLRAFTTVAGGVTERAVERLTLVGAMVVLGAILLTLILMLPVRRFARAFVQRDRLGGEPSRLQRATAAASITLVSAVVPTLAAWILVQAIGSLDLLPPRMVQSVRTLVGAVAFVAFVRGLAGGILAPDPARANWRLFAISDDNARALLRLATLAAFLFVANRILEAVYQAIAAGIHLTVATEAVFAILIVVTVANALPLIRRVVARGRGGVRTPCLRHGGFHGCDPRHRLAPGFGRDRSRRAWITSPSRGSSQTRWFGHRCC